MSILLNPGMSKMREEKRQTGRESSQAGPSEEFCAAAALGRRGSRGFYSRGAQRVMERAGGQPGCSEPLESPRSRHLVSLSPLQ